MRFWKTVLPMGLAATAMAVAAVNASATTITSPTGTQYDGRITVVSEEYVTIHGSFGVQAKCTKHWTGDITVNGAHPVPTTAASGVIETFSFTNCTDNYIVHVLTNASGNKGTVAINSSGEVRGTGQTLNVTTPLGITCEYTTNNTVIGILTDSHETGTTATLHTNGSIPRTAGSFLCGSTGIWTGSDWVTATESGTDKLYID